MTSTLNLTPDLIRQQQRILNSALGLELDEDGVAGPKTDAAFAEFADAWDLGVSTQVAPASEVHAVLASSFADPADVAAFRRAKAQGMSDEEAFRYGDNGIGEWGDSTVQGTGPSCALPPEDWQHLTHPSGTPVLVTMGSVMVTAALKDSMPHKVNITNGCGLDMNPDLCAALGVKPGGEWHVTWQWA